MKRIIALSVLAIAILGSILAGTLAYYTVSIDELATGSAVAKEFVFTSEGTDSFVKNVKIAPMESVKWQFNVKNYEGNIITETNLYYKLKFRVSATEDKSAIEPLTVKVKDAEGNLLNSIVGTGTFDVFGKFMFSEQGQSDNYSVEIYWPDGDKDINYAGENFGTSLKVSAVASQMPLDGQSPEVPSDPDEEDEYIEEKDVQVIYQTTNAWQNNGEPYKFEWGIVITNNTDETLHNWEIAFELPNVTMIEDKLWNANRNDYGLPDGRFNFYHMQTYDFDIEPGKSVAFGGHAEGMGNEEIRNLTLKGTNVEFTTEDINIDLKLGIEQKQFVGQ